MNSASCYKSLGFSSVELLSVIALLGVLTASTLQTYKLAMMRAHDSALDSAIHSTRYAVENHLADLESENTANRVDGISSGNISGIYTAQFTNPSELSVKALYDRDPVNGNYNITIKAVRCRSGRSHLKSWRSDGIVVAAEMNEPLNERPFCR